MRPSRSSPRPLRPARAAPTSPSAPSRLADELGYLLWRAGKLSAKVARLSLVQLGVRARQYAVLAFCDERGPVSQRAISNALDLDPSATVAVLDSLEQAGYVERRPDPNDRRVRLIAVTDHGRAFLGDCKRAIERSSARLAAELTLAERRQLEALLRRVLLANEPDAVQLSPEGLTARRS